MTTHWVINTCSAAVGLRLLAAAVTGLASLTAATMPAQAQSVAVFVNGDPITTYDIEQRNKLIQLTMHKTPPRQEVISELIDEKIKLQLMKRYQFPVTDQDIDKEVDKSYAGIANRMQMSPDQLTKNLASNGINSVTFKSRLKADYIWTQIIQGKFQSSLQIGEKDILEALEHKKSDNIAVSYEFTLRPILFVVPRGSPSAAFESRTREAEALRARFQNCNDGLPFARAIRDVVVRDQIIQQSADLAPALRDILNNTSIGKLTAPEVTQHGIEIFAVCSKKEADASSISKRQTRNEIFSAQFQSKAKRYLDELRRGAMIERLE